MQPLRQDTRDSQERAADAAQTRKDAERVRAFQSLVASDGWRFLVELLNGKVEDLMANAFERPSGAVNELRGQDFDKGTCYGLLWMRDLPDVTIAAFKQESSDPANEENET